uniref:Tc1-like transposase DDE domain-containing protein n=2 Tax=Cyprinus carpio carpio TaxID=630221 RepID=A0A9J8AZP5_CYPCA
MVTITVGIVVCPVWINGCVLKHYFENEVSVLGNASKGLRRSCKYTLHNFFLFCSMPMPVPAPRSICECTHDFTITPGKHISVVTINGRYNVCLPRKSCSSCFAEWTPEVKDLFIYRYWPASISCQTLYKFDVFTSFEHLKFFLENWDDIRNKEDKDNPSCYQRSVQKPASLMVWGCMSACGMGSLHICKGTINAERYIQVLEQHMLPSRRRLFQGRPCIFQHDNARPHTASITTSWLRRRRIRVLKWPACSPDLSPIENIWSIIKRKM